MLTVSTFDFAEWLKGEVEDRGWTGRELARRAELSSGVVSQVMTGFSQPGPDFCRGIARAFRIPPERVFRIAGLLPPIVIGTAGERTVAEINDLLRYLKNGDLETVYAVAKTLYEKQHS